MLQEFAVCFPGALMPFFFFFFCPEKLEAEYYHGCDEINISLPREKTPDDQEDGLASTPLQAMRSSLTAGEKQEDADNLKNSTRASQAGLNSNAIHIPVTITAPPGETTLIPSECHHSSVLTRIRKFAFLCTCLFQSSEQHRLRELPNP